ncbi:MAG: hypothetical protein PUC72_05995 [Bacteroidales bacterium]|nr:hypothetical protein [Bacteroidales bacterium]
MKTSRYIILSLAAVAIAASCKEELNPDKPINANPGDEVVFGAALPGKTKTVYGEENTVTNTFPIYWVNGDKVRVASPQCMSGRNSAEYQVTVETEVQNYATSMTKIGDAGVQWGDAVKADFYSIYPSSASTKLNVEGDDVTTTLHVDATQFASTSTKNNGTSDYFYAQPAEMGNVVMYAKTAGVESGDTVKLHYTPFSTVLEFEINAPSTNTGNQKSEITIQSLTLTAPTGTTIAGDFGFNFDGPSITPDATGGSNAITMHFLDNNQYKTVLSTTKTTLKAKMCLMPISGNLAGWKIEVNTSAGTFSKNLAATDSKGTATTLDPGKVHKIKLPTLNYASTEWVYDEKNWITSIPDYTNIYLSELSLPGAWYAGSTESYQATNDIATLWKAGVRAFAVETRTTSTGSSWLLGDVAQDTPNGIALSGSQSNSIDRYSAGTNSLGTGSSSRAKVSYSGTSIATIITNIAKQVPDNEFGVLVLSYADGGNSGHRPVDYGAWLQLLYNAYNGLGADVKEKIYKGQVDANTTVNSVLGRLILKINVDANIAMSGRVSSTNFTYNNILPALFSYNPFLIQMEGADYTRPYYSNLSWSNWGDGSDYRSYNLVSSLQGASGNADKFIWVFSSANRTRLNTETNTTIPTYENRQTALKAMMNFSNQIYQASTHNVWFYFNCGGTQATSSTSDNPSPTTFASTMNSWLLETINKKTDPSPLGIVMFNQCTSDTYNGPAIIKAIIEMNSKFYLKHAGTSGGSTGGSTSGNEAPNDATLDNGGKAI